MKGVLIAGDDDQVVYAWQGADPNILLDAAVDEDVVLPNSYRLPSRILDVVNREVRHIEKRQEKDLNPRKEGGTVEAVESPSMLDLVRNVRATVAETPDETIMVLFRARYQMFQFLDEFISEGMPFRVLTDQRMWTDRLQQFISAVEKIDNDEDIDGLEARRLADMLADSAFSSNDRDDLFTEIDERKEAAGAENIEEITVDPETIREHAPFVPDPVSAADMSRKITSFQRKSMNAYFTTGTYLGADPERVRVGTIHSAKGREADHVFVATDLTEKVVEQMAATIEQAQVPIEREFTRTTSPVPMLTDNERRVFYVGMSRARERLVLLENLVNGAPTLPIDVLLCNEPREEPVEELIAEADAPEAEAH